MFKYLTVLIIPVLSLTAFASPQLRPFATFSGGNQYFSSTQDNSFQVNFSSYNFHPTSNNNTNVVFGVLGGFEYRANTTIAVQAGISYFYPGSFKIPGSLAQGVDPQSYQYFNFNYKIKSQEVLVESKVLATKLPGFMPYFSLGLGAAFNQAYNYTSGTNGPSFMTFTPVFGNGSTRSSFAYLLGIGFDAIISDHCRLGLGYRYNGLGNVALGSATINTTTVTNTISTNNLYAQSLLAQFSYLI